MKERIKVSLDRPGFKIITAVWYLLLLLFIWYAVAPENAIEVSVLALFTFVLFAFWWLTMGRTYKVEFFPREETYKFTRFNSSSIKREKRIFLTKVFVLGQVTGVYLLELDGSKFYYFGQRGTLWGFLFTPDEYLEKEKNRLSLLLGDNFPKS